MPDPSPLDDVSFLARSPHRVAVLETLAAGPRSRRDLHEATGISQPTLSRILGPFEERNWIERRDGEYTLTPWGELLATEFGDLLETTATVQRLGTVTDLLPAGAMEFDIRRLGDATVTTPEPGDLLRHVRRAEAVLREGQHLRILAASISPEALAEQRDRLAADGDLRLETVITEDALRQALANPAVVDLVRDLLESGRAPVHRYDGSLPMPLFARVDDLVVLAPADERGIPGVLVESRDEAVRAWVDDQFEQYRSQSTRLTVDDLPG